MPTPSIRGLWPALLIPVHADGSVDTPRAIAHAHHLLGSGCDGITLCGTTGEGLAFTVAERNALLESMLGSGIGPHRIVVTTTALALADAIELGQHAARLGVHRQMCMPPFYFNNPSDDGVMDFYRQLIEGIGDEQLQLLLYHFPAISTYGFSHDTIRTLVERHPQHIAGIKDSSGDLEHSLGLARAFPHLSVLVGSEPHVAPTMCVGGAGSINGMANIAPRLMQRVMAKPHAVSPADSQTINDLLAILFFKPSVSFIAAYKGMLAEQTGDDAWLRVRTPLSAMESTDLQTLRSRYRALGTALNSL
ncbi:dihydrodipicolinate synthase family protein [Curvibacter sp. CHRR-16]|uniref:dihydrodipicolinate synthase family protein n=1 Tax=Curvibacter sp. CHRR-16 TaxID=2835872 RepID=UPI001BDAC87A|nr:dihydrodipicolinate synthase family protein [Curvibacter sp. CHRR-16]MBT0568937.1 dihydrodipicolinate synthase family protein [Curvibacter sp. CHRR-16]